MTVFIRINVEIFLNDTFVQFEFNIKNSNDIIFFEFP